MPDIAVLSTLIVAHEHKRDQLLEEIKDLETYAEKVLSTYVTRYLNLIQSGRCVSVKYPAVVGIGDTFTSQEIFPILLKHLQESYQSYPDLFGYAMVRSEIDVRKEQCLKLQKEIALQEAVLASLRKGGIPTCILDGGKVLPASEFDKIPRLYEEVK